MRAITTSASLGKDDSSLASTRAALDLVEEYSFLKLRKREVREGSVLVVNGGRIVGRDSFHPDMSFEEQPLPAVRAPNEARASLARLAALHAI